MDISGISGLLCFDEERTIEVYTSSTLDNQSESVPQVSTCHQQFIQNNAVKLKLSIKQHYNEG